MRYRVRRHPLVGDDLEVIVRLIAGYAGADVALAKLDDIERRMHALADTPHIGSLRHEILPGLRAIPAARKGVIAFRVDDAAREVHVLCVVYGGADWAGRVMKRRP